MVRHHNWPVRLDTHCHALEKNPFEWGRHDCVLFAAGCIQEMTGVDTAAEWRGRYKSPRGALGLLKEAGGLEALVEKIMEAHGCHEWPTPKLAQRGDLVLFDEADGGPSLGVVWLDGIDVVATGPDGLVRFPVAAARRAWHIPSAEKAGPGE